MPGRRTLSSLLAVVTLAQLASAPAAWAESDKRACLDAYVEAQTARREGKLLEARKAAVTCGARTCPGVLQADCVPWLRELDAAIPTVVLSASATGGRDLPGARVTLDGRDVAIASGVEVPLDPGAHTLVCEADGYRPAQVRLVAAQGAKGRAVHFLLEPIDVPGAAPASVAIARPVPALVYVLGALGIVGAGVWGGVGASAFWGNPGVESLQRCKPDCNPADRQDVERRLVITDVAGATAVVALAGAVILYLVRPTVPGGERSGTPGWSVTF